MGILKHSEKKELKVSNKTDSYKDKSPKDIFQEFDVDPKKGLYEEDIEKRQEQYGFNEIPDKEESLFHRILRRFYGPIPFMIEIAAALSAVVHKWEDFGIILSLLFVNAGIDIWQENKALSALKVLKNQLAKKSIVFRDGKFKQIEAKELVPGDIIKMKIGDIIPADVKIFHSDELEVDQSALTGESLPVNKKTGDIAFGNSIIKKGEALAVVVNTGLNSYFGKTVSLVAKADKVSRSHLQKAVINIGKYLIIIAVALALLIFTVSLVRGQNLLEILRFVLVLTVASIPVAMPAILSVTLAVGAVKLSKKHAIVSKLASIEELAGMDTLCFDKTGTLTQNRMSIDNPIVFGRYKEEELMLYAALASNEEEKDPIETPIFDYLKDKKIYEKLEGYERLKFKPFNPVDKRTESLVKQGSKKFSVTKGAVQVILGFSRTTKKDKILETVKKFSDEGMRTLAVAIKKGTGKYDFVGVIPLLDPPREDTKEVIQEARELGLDLKVLTGDNISIAKYISELVGVGKNILNARILKKKTEIGGKGTVKTVSEKSQNLKIDESGYSSSSDVEAEIESANGFAEVYPEDKYFIVENIQKRNHIVGMTGDGVNDAPALRKADGGIAVSGATDAARAAADLILLDKGLSVIIDAVKEARKIFLRMKSYSVYRIAETMRLIFFITASIVALGFYPISAVMVILLLIFNDLPILAIAYDNTSIEKRPVRWNLKEVLIVATSLGIIGVIESFIALYAAKVWLGLDVGVVQSLIFMKLAVAGHLTIYVARTKKRFWQKPFPAPVLLIAGFGTEILATLIAVYGILITPVGWTYALIMWGYAIFWIFIEDQIKIWIYGAIDKKKDKVEEEKEKLREIKMPMIGAQNPALSK